MRTFIFTNGTKSETILAHNMELAWVELRRRVGTIIDWELSGAQG